MRAIAPLVKPDSRLSRFVLLAVALQPDSSGPERKDVRHHLLDEHDGEENWCWMMMNNDD